MALIQPCESTPEASHFPEGVLRLDYLSGVDRRADWAMVWPSNSRRDWLVCIHGHGSTGDQLFTRPDIRDLWLPSFRAAGLSIVTPNLRGNAWMSPAAVSDIADLLAYLRTSHGAQRFFFASGSMGGTSNVIYAACRPDDVAGLVALCPATDLATYHAWCKLRTSTPVIAQIMQAIEANYDGPPELRNDVYRRHSAIENAARLTMPLFLSHGDNDAIIPYIQATSLADAMCERASFHFESLRGGHHDSPLLSMPSALKWVLDRAGS